MSLDLSHGSTRPRPDHAFLGQIDYAKLACGKMRLPHHQNMTVHWSDVCFLYFTCKDSARSFTRHTRCTAHVLTTLEHSWLPTSDSRDIWRASRRP